MKRPEAKAVEETLATSGVHVKWKSEYRTGANEKFYERAFDYITSVLNAARTATILDVGCGSCAHSVRLANRGFRVVATDLSESALNMAEANVQARGLQDKIKLQRENLLSLTFQDGTFNYVLCWGVLMHIPDVKKAISELARVTKPGGKVVVSEANMHSLQARMLRNMKRVLGRKEKADVRRTPAGLEYWADTPDGTLMTREADVRWLIAGFRNNGLVVRKHVSGQFTELYTRVSFSPVQKLVHGFNNLWFKYLGFPGLAFGNLIIFQKQA